MNIVTKDMLIKDIAKTWKHTYPNDKYGEDKINIHNKLLQLKPNATEEEVTSIIGNKSWTTNRCDECGKDSNSTIILGAEYDHDSNAVSICPKCIKEAFKKVAK